MKIGCVCLVCLMAVCLTGCESGPMYRWGDYEKSVYQMYMRKDFSPAKEIDRLQRTVDKTRQSKQKVGPGVQAYLGYLYTIQGDTVAAAKAFNAEKQDFPESQVMMDRLLSRLP